MTLYVVRLSPFFHTAAYSKSLPKKALLDTLLTCMTPSRRKTMMWSMSEQSPSNSPSVRLRPVPTNPSAGFQYSLALATATLLRSMDSKVRNSVLRSRPLPYFSLSFLNQSMA